MTTLKSTQHIGCLFRLCTREYYYLQLSRVLPFRGGLHTNFFPPTSYLHYKSPPPDYNEGHTLRFD